MIQKCEKWIDPFGPAQRGFGGQVGVALAVDTMLGEREV